ncbi:MAG: glycosyltransferase family 2 protein [Ignavibacteria bacterium]|nr:glycosyltransferase family 2 protein [Ignavibacteria bacterium]
MVDVSVIIVNLNTRDLLRACLESVFSEGGAIELEVIVIDNGSTDGSVEMIRVQFPIVRLVENKINRGFAQPNNEGMRLAGGKYLLLLNSDTIVRRGAITAMVHFLDSHLDAGACGPMLLSPNGVLQRSVKGFPTLWTHFCDMVFLDKLFPDSGVFARGEMTFFPYHETRQVDHVTGAVFLVRREALDGIGMFDERFSIYYNDMDLCYRMAKRDWRVYYVHSVQVVHYQGQTVAQVNQDFRYFSELHNNIMLFYQKHYGRWSVVVYKVLLLIGFIPRSLGWTFYQVLKPSAHANLMARFSWKTLGVGVRFWAPLAESRL